MSDRKRETIRELREKIIQLQDDLTLSSVNYEALRKEFFESEEEIRRQRDIIDCTRRAFSIQNEITRIIFQKNLLGKTLNANVAQKMIEEVIQAERLKQEAEEASKKDQVKPKLHYSVTWVRDLPNGQRMGSPGSPKIDAIKFVRELTNCSLKDGKDFVEGSIALTLSEDSVSKLQARYGMLCFVTNSK